MRILDSRNVVVREELRLHEDGNHRTLWRGQSLLADDSLDTHARAARFALDAAPLTGKTVAWIGGGFCVGPRLFAIADCKQTVYELEPRLAEFAPEGVRFIAGDYRDTLSGKYDIIVYDLGGDVPRGLLAQFIAPGGMILPKE